MPTEPAKEECVPDSCVVSRPRPQARLGCAALLVHKSWRRFLVVASGFGRGRRWLLLLRGAHVIHRVWWMVDIG